jgi:tRNA C32,U32 (ribose-2'-O)-methylase TrmJ
MREEILSFKELEAEIIKEHCPQDPVAQLLVHIGSCALQFAIVFGRERRGLPIVKEDAEAREEVSSDQG